MFRIVGTYQNYSYVLDTSDSSCELIETKKLRNSGIECIQAQDKELNINLMRMVYDFNVTTMGGKNLYCFSVDKSLLYNIPVVSFDGGRDKFRCTLLMGLMVIPKEFVVMSRASGVAVINASSDYVIFLSCQCLPPVQPSMSTGLPLQRILIGENTSNQFYYDGFVIPPSMLMYIASLMCNKDGMGVLDSFDGVFSTKLVVEYEHILYKFDKDGQIEFKHIP